MTGFDSKRQAAQAKLDDAADTLTIVYQRGFADGKKAAQRKQLTEERLKEIWYATQNIMGWYSFQEIARAIEADHGIKEQP
jgi:hypothetical protein